MATKEEVAVSFVSGTFAGLICDTSLFPIDTIKTRLQSKHGFIKAGGFRGVYRGFASMMAGSPPSNACFFVTYEVSKVHLHDRFSSDATCHMFSGAIGEVASISARMPFEVVKQTAQASKILDSRGALTYVLRTNGLRGLYSGYFSTIYRDVPFSAMLMPIWEYLKVSLRRYKNVEEITGFESGACGGIASAISAFITTPMDVAKTRIILSHKSNHDYTENPFRICWRILQEEGVMRLFSGVVPRVALMSCGGVLFFGAYDLAKTRCQYVLCSAEEADTLIINT